MSGTLVNVLVRQQAELGEPVRDSARLARLGLFGNDPLFKEALKVVRATWTNARGSRATAINAFFTSNMAYMLLWLVIERYLTFRYSLGDAANAIR